MTKMKFNFRISLFALKLDEERQSEVILDVGICLAFIQQPLYLIIHCIILCIMLCRKKTAETKIKSFRHQKSGSHDNEATLSLITASIYHH